MSYPDVSWKFDDEEQFQTEYAREEITSATIMLFNVGFKFRVDYNKYFKGPETQVSVELSKINNIEKVFSILDEYYEKYLKELEEKRLRVEAVRPEIPLPYYDLNTIIPSTLVDIKLLAELEKYIYQRGRQLIDDEEKNKFEYTITILDSSGTLRLESISSYPRDIFDNDIYYLKAKYDSLYSSFEISIVFTKDRDPSKVKIAYKGENAREIVESIKSGIFKLLNENKTSNSFYHSPLLQLFLGTMAVISSFMTVAYLITKNIKGVSTGLLVFFTLFLLLGAPSLKPYIVFDTRKNRSIIGWNKWLIQAVLAALLGWILFSFLIPAAFP